MSAMATTLLKTLTMATKLTLPPHFTSHSHHLSLPFTPIKPPFTLSLSYPSKFTTFVAKTTPHWDPQHQQDTAFSLESGTHQHHVDDGYGGGDVESESQRFDLGGGEYVSPTEKDISFALGSGTHHHDDGDGDGASDSQRLDLGGGDYVGPTESETEIVKLFVGNLSYDVDHDELAQVFEAAGEVQFAEVIYNRDTKASRGFGFVTMSTIEEVERAEEMFNGKELRGRLLVVNKAAPKGSRLEKPPREYKPSFRIYAGNLPWNVDDVRLEQEFSKYGEVIRAWVLSDKETGRSRGFGFVTMASEAGMNDAIAALDGQTLDGRTIRVDVAEDRPRF